MFKANNHICKKHGFSKFDHTWVRKKTRQNELDGWKHDGWVLAFWLSIYHSWFPWEYGWICWPCLRAWMQEKFSFPVSQSDFLTQKKHAIAKKCSWENFFLHVLSFQKKKVGVFPSVDELRCYTFRPCFSSPTTAAFGLSKLSCRQFLICFFSLSTAWRLNHGSTGIWGTYLELPQLCSITKTFTPGL